MKLTRRVAGESTGLVSRPINRSVCIGLLPFFFFVCFFFSFFLGGGVCVCIVFCFRVGIPEGQGCGLCSGTPRGAARSRRRRRAEQRSPRAERWRAVGGGRTGAGHGRAGAVPAARLRMAFRLPSAGCESAYGCAFTRVRSSVSPGKGEQPPAAPPVTVPAHPPRGRLLRRGWSRRRPGVRQG